MIISSQYPVQQTVRRLAVCSLWIVAAKDGARCLPKLLEATLRVLEAVVDVVGSFRSSYPPNADKDAVGPRKYIPLASAAPNTPAVDAQSQYRDSLFMPGSEGSESSATPKGSGDNEGPPNHLRVSLCLADVGTHKEGFTE